jgi:hypothetical protein
VLQGALDKKEVASASSPEKKKSTTPVSPDKKKLTAMASPDKKKKASKLPVKVCAPVAQEEQQPQQVKLCCKPRACDYLPLKLLVFNVHGTLLDYSLLLDKNPNPTLRPIFKIENRRVLIRPWLSELLCKCFKNFKVGFWGSKSKRYMDEMVPALLGRVRSPEPLVPAFVWSQKECDVTQWWNNDHVVWGCLLEVVYQKWPHWNSSNTVIIDHNPGQVSCNPRANVIVVSPFYHAQLTKVGDDNLFLKTSLWPQLSGLFALVDMVDFETHYPELRLQEPETIDKESYEDKNIIGDLQSIQGEGTCGPVGPTCMMSPHLALNSLFDFVICCMCRPNGRRDKREDQSWQRKQRNCRRKQWHW